MKQADVNTDQANPQKKEDDLEVEIPVDNIDAEVNILKMQNADLLRCSQRVSNFYFSLVKSIAGKSEPNNECLNGLPNELKSKLNDCVQGVAKSKDLQCLRLSLKDNGLKDVISEILKKSGLEKELDADPPRCEFEEISKGIFMISIDKDLYLRIYGEKFPLAIINKKGISFIATLKEYKERGSRDAAYEKNLLREFHYLVWSFLVSNGNISSTEKNQGMKICFEYIQGKIIGKLLVDEVAEYNNSFLSMSEKFLVNFRMEYPDKKKEADEHMLELNEAIDDIMPILKEVSVKKQSLVYPVMEARNFEELAEYLKKFKTAIEAKLIDKTKHGSLEENRNLVSI